LYTLDVIIGPRGYRHLGEMRHFLALPHFKTVFITSEGNMPLNGNVEYIPVSERGLLPDFLAERFVRKPYGPVSFMSLQLPRGGLDGDIINSPELYSFTSRQGAKEATRKRSKLSISSWETISSNPLFFFPPYLFNVAEVKQRADVFLVPTVLAAKCLRDLGVPTGRIRVLRPGIDLTLFAAARVQHDGFRVLFVGRLDPEKGIGTLLRAFAAFHHRHQEAELLLCGPTRSGDVLEREARRLSSKYPIKLLGEIPQNELRSIYTKCDVLCLPSIDRWKWGFKVWEEQFGWALIEAMANGLPVVATDCGAIREVVGDHNLVVKQGSDSSLEQAFCKFAEDKNHYDNVSRLNRERALTLHDLNKQRLELDGVFVDLVED
jgi:glycosyltransferase involved in cell wall biosynthesis